MYNEEVNLSKQDCRLLPNKDDVEILFCKNENKKSGTH